ncbi:MULTISPECIES: hypothetical protein [Methylobacterium]|jgi:hypothetical protein|uniref:hypothetical protein n=1 Tax=Methylobacterium TaxID=407 RepID=UPI0008EAF15E|nr:MULTISPECIES: hypothetical protein [Methylobacterium]MBZ6412687.1 hypothetical protein [Methylobacterium sp.]MBK3398511.1 hypothetical protein [Methylobacterium ajmalii]MBK3407711.1 hypothetical protein [Methylobacterium ajmalii]MBK3422198.1 hypothetical protein [Methylobacterium ajmalii]SFF27984.1 hypothetical protein SAMN04487844_11395 [Methylobacterium sp. yr596]
MTIDVYRNLVRRAWSIREAGLVVGHEQAVALRDVRFVVSEAARQRTLRLRQRAVMAWATGTRCEAPRYPSAIRVRFDPYAGPNFTTEDGTVVLRASLVRFEEDGSCWCVL